MKKKIDRGDAPIGKVTIIKDFLPPPSELVFREPQVKVTLALSKESVDFFKQEAQKHGAPYQRMIRNLVDHYVAEHRPNA